MDSSLYPGLSLEVASALYMLFAAIDDALRNEKFQCIYMIHKFQFTRYTTLVFSFKQVQLCVYDTVRPSVDTESLKLYIQHEFHS